ncbi:unnamed protein product [Lepeophtheirus salmonis]|uniref:(salmon louse) hypothetical protein n=1 Tax=Lepeophtheirus salmonis TaxID=72036 RepID=A0A7R8HBN2_LEPSM|nr:unnamed protein product [Lepeophtheirus salmonis]CAF2989061.1 unnamed protein product [Lepeophtheirus salmonis]
MMKKKNVLLIKNIILLEFSAIKLFRDEVLLTTRLPVLYCHTVYPTPSQRLRYIKISSRHFLQIMLICVLVLIFVVDEALPFDNESEETSRQLTHQLLDLNLGYNVFSTDVLKRFNDSPFESDYGYIHDSDVAFRDPQNNDDGLGENDFFLHASSEQRHPRDFENSGRGGEDLWTSESFWPARPARRPRFFQGFPRYRRRFRPHTKTFDKTTRPELEYGPIQNEPTCGLSNNNHNVAQRRIVGGDEAGFGSFPWQAYIRIGTSRCGGSLVNEWYVITAGHCVARASANQIRVTLGEYVLKSHAEPLPGRTYGASRIKLFVFKNRRVDYAPHISPICLPPKNMEMSNYHGWASGWGALEAGSRLRPKTLQVVDVPMIANRECEKWHRRKGINVIIYDEMVCAGYFKGGKDSCQGDSGGPLMTEVDGRWTLIGIVSAGYSCAKRGQPGIYHRVPHTSDWISHSISS